MSCGALAHGSGRMLGHARWLTFVRRSPHGFSRLGSSLFTSSGATFCGVAISCNAPLPITASPRERLKSRPPTLLRALPTPRLGRRRCADYALATAAATIPIDRSADAGDRRGRAPACRIERVGGRQTVLRTLTNMTTTPIAEVSDLQDPNAGDPSPAGLADGLRSRGELRGAVAPCSRRAASRVAGRSSGSPQRSAPSSISAASFRPPSSCAGCSRGLTTWRRPGNLPRP